MSLTFDLKKSQTDETYVENLYCQTLRTPSNYQSELILRLALQLFANDNTLVRTNPYQHLEKMMKESLKMKHLKLTRIAENMLYKNFKEDDKIMVNHLMLLYMAGATTRADAMLEKLKSKDMRSLELAHVKLAYYKSLMTRSEYIEELKEHLQKEFMDADGWLELAQLYEENMDFQNAVFCYEEVLLLKADDIRLYSKLGELYFTLGEAGNWVIAKKYFSHVLLQQADNLRALYGLRNALKFLNQENEKPSRLDLKLQKQVEKKIKALDRF